MQDRFILGVDLDGTAANYEDALRKRALKHFNVPEKDSMVRFPTATSYSFVESGWPFSSTAEYLNFHATCVEDGMLKEIEPYEGVSETLHDLHDIGVEIFIVTHRLLRKGKYATIIGDTVEWLDRNNIPYDHFSATKAKDLISPHLYLDDAPENIAAIRRSGSQAAVFDQAYNQDVQGLRVHNWKEVGDLVRTLSGVGL